VQFESPRFQGDQLLLDILNDPDTGNLKLGPGSPADSVKRLQGALFDLNWTVQAGVTDSSGFPHTPATFVIGIYGPATKTTVLAYKRNYDLHFPPSAPTGFIDEFAGPRTFRKLDPQCAGFDARVAAIEQKAADLRAEGHSVSLFTSTTAPTTRPVLKSNGVRREADDLDGDLAIFYCHNLGFGAFEVHGPILDEYLRRGSAAGPLGFPISDVHEDDPGFLRSDFERGALLLDVGAGSVSLVPPVTVPPTPGATLF
jgi:hypothetical protein